VSPQIAHVFYETYMGLGHASLRELMKSKVKRDIRKGEVAVFLNKAWTGVKVLAPSGAILYFRSDSPLTSDMIRFLPTMFGGSRLSYNGGLESALQRAFEKRFGKQMSKIKVA